MIYSSHKEINKAVIHNKSMRSMPVKTIICKVARELLSEYAITWAILLLILIIA